MPHVCAKHVAGPFHAADQRLIDTPIRVAGSIRAGAARTGARRDAGA